MCPLMAGLVLLGVSAVVSAANGIGKGGLDLSKTREIAEDIACDMCGYIAVWTSFFAVQHSGLGAAFSSLACAGGSLAEPGG